MSNNNFVSYEYKEITVKRASVEMYVDCLDNFGWTLVDDGYLSLQDILAPLHAAAGTSGTLDMVELKFKRHRKIENKQELNKLEHRCEEALAAIGKIERKSHAYTMGTSLGVGIVGTAILAFAVYGFIASNVVLGVILSILGVAAWGIGFLAYRKMSNKEKTQNEPLIQQQMDTAYDVCEQAHALLA